MFHLPIILVVVLHYAATVTQGSSVFINVSQTALRVNETFNLTVGGLTASSYSFNFGDSNSHAFSNESEVVQHAYTSPGTYTIQLTTNDPSASASIVVNVQEVLTNMTLPYKPFICAVGQQINLSANVIPNIPVTFLFKVRWDGNNETVMNWTTASSFTCTQLGYHSLSAAAENDVSVVTIRCGGALHALSLKIDVNSLDVAPNQIIQFRRSGTNGSYSYSWQFEAGGPTLNTSDLTVNHSYQVEPNVRTETVALRAHAPDGQFLESVAQLRIYNPIQKPLQVIYTELIPIKESVTFSLANVTGDNVTYVWDFGDNSSTSNVGAHTYNKEGTYCVKVVANNPVSEAQLTFDVTAVEAVEGLDFIEQTKPVSLGMEAKIGIELLNGTNVNVTIEFGDSSPPVHIVDIENVKDLFVISAKHNYTDVGEYNVTVIAQNKLNTMVKSMVIIVEIPITNLTVKMSHDSPVIEVNATVNFTIQVNGTAPTFIYEFGDGDGSTINGTNATSVTHKYVSQGVYRVKITAYNHASSVTDNATIAKVWKPVLPLTDFAVSTSPVALTNLTSPSTIVLTFSMGSDFRCTFDLGDGELVLKLPNCFNKTYYEDGITSDTTPFQNLRFEFQHNYSSVGSYELKAFCSNRLGNASDVIYAVVERPITGFVLPSLPPQALGDAFGVPWNLSLGTNVTFTLKINSIEVKSAITTDEGGLINVTLDDYKAEGLHSFELLAKNLVSNATEQISVLVQAAVGTIILKANGTKNDPLLGKEYDGPDNNIFPAEHPIQFTAVVDTGTNLTYMWQPTASTLQNTTEPKLVYKFEPEKEQMYEVRVTAYNLVSSKTNVTRVWTQQSTRGLAVTVDSPRRVNEMTTFQLSFAAFGSGTCVRLNMGDGTPVKLIGDHCPAPRIPNRNDTSIPVKHNYTTVDEFTVQANASNNVSFESVEIKAVTVELPCDYPNVTIKDIGRNSSTAKKIKKSESLTLLLDVHIRCEASKTTSFAWKVYRVADREEVSLKNNKIAELFIPKRDLKYGLYEIEATVSMDGVQGVSTSDTGFVEIDNTPYLTARIGPSFVKRKWGANVSLDASPSFDPDYGENDYTNMTFTWLCRNASEPGFNLRNLSAIAAVKIPTGFSNATNGGCFGTGAGRLPETGPMASLNTKLGMVENASYVIVLVVVKTNQFGKKQGTVEQTIMLVDGDPPDLSITCVQNCKRKVNIDQSLGIRGNNSDNFDGPLVFEWNLMVGAADKPIPSRELQSMLYTRIDYHNLIIQPLMLNKNITYTLKLEAHRPGSNVKGESRYTFKTNAPPEDGECDISPRSGLAFNTTFRIWCRGWEDPDPELRYEFATVNGDLVSTFHSSHENFTSSVLPLGVPAQNFSLVVVFRVFDGLGAFTQRNATVKVGPMTNSGEENVVALLGAQMVGDDSRLKQLIRTGDLQSVNQLITSVSSVLNYESEQVDRHRNTSLPQEKSIQKDKDKRTTIRSAMIEDLAAIPPVSLRAVKLLAPSYDTATEIVDEVDDRSQELSLKALESMQETVKAASQAGVTRNEIIDSASGVLASVGNIMMASALHAQVERNDTQVNITAITDGKTNRSGLVSSKERARERTLEGYKLLKSLNRVVLGNSLAGEPKLTIKTANTLISLHRVSLEDLGNSSFSDEEANVILPSNADMGIVLQDRTSHNEKPVDKSMLTFAQSPFTWETTSREVKSSVVDFSLEDPSGKQLNTSNFSSVVNIHVPRNDSKIPPPSTTHLRPLGDGSGGQMQFHTFDVLSPSHSLHVEVQPLNSSHSYVVYIKFEKRPTTTNFDLKFTMPDLSSCTLSNATFGETPSDSILHVNAKKDCERDPYSLLLSNTITKKGLYYIGVYYEPPKSPQPLDPTAPPSEAPERRRRAIPCGEHGGRSRRSSSCVIIPSPPPKPTTKDPNFVGTRPANLDHQGNEFNINDSSHYSVRFFSSNCLYWDTENETWTNKGCEVGEKTTTSNVHCKCNHLTSFASDFLVAPNPIDFDKVFSADLSENFVVITVVCLLFGLYFILAVWVRRKDKEDLAKLGATAVGNVSGQGSTYRISIHTGVRENAGTTANVCLVLSGSKAESPPTLLLDPRRTTFGRGQDNSFEVTVQNDLGTLNHIRIWHDNSGTNPSWYLSRIKVEKLNSQELWYFICERWLAVEEDDGRVDRILPVANEKELTHFQHLFVSKTVKELGDGHLWFSVFTRPPASTFTRLQRLSCCLSLLCCTMITNAMFYNLGGAANSQSNYVIMIGSLTIDYRSLIIGIQSSLIIFPVNLALVQIFRNVRPKEHKTTPQSEQQRVSKGSASSRSSGDVSISNVCLQKAEANETKKRGIPHCWLYFAWALCFLSSVSAAIFTVFYSLSWGPEIANEWLLTFVLSFFQSILVIQPVKVVFAAIFFALVIKKPVAQEEGKSQRDPSLDTLTEERATEAIFEIEDNFRYRPPNEEFLKVARVKRLKEIAMVSIIKEVLTFFIFYIALLLVAYGNRDTYSYLLRKTLHETFVELDDTMVNLEEATDVDTTWHWVRETLVPGLYPGVLYNNRSDKYKGFIDDRYNYLVGISRLRQVRVEKGSCEITEEFRPHFNDCFTGYSMSSEEKGDFDVAWKPLSKNAKPSRRRRSVAEQFSFVDKNQRLLEYGPESHSRRDRRAVEPIYQSTSGRQKRKKAKTSRSKVYFVLDSAVLPDGSIISCPTRWLYHNMFALRGYPFWGRLTVYNGGGYPADLGYDYATAMTVVADLHSHNWADAQTRSIFAEFTVYNANVNLFGIAYLFIEFLPTGGALPYAQFQVARLYNYVGPYSNFLLALEVLVLLFMLYFMYREGKSLYQQGRKYFRGFWNWLEVVMIVLEFTAFILFFARLWEVDKNLIELHHNPKDFVSFQYAGAADATLMYVIGALVFLVTLRLVKLLRFNRRMALLGNTIGSMAKPLAMFMISFLIVFTGFGFVGYLVFGVESDNFRSYVRTLVTQTSIVLGDFNFHEMEAIDRVLGRAYFFGFMYFVVMYLMNMFMAIINDTLADVKDDNDKQTNEYEMVDFIMERFKGYVIKKKAVSSVLTSASILSSSAFLPPPSAYKHWDDFEESKKSDEEIPEQNVFSVVRSLSRLNKDIDFIGELLEAAYEDRLYSDRTFIVTVLKSYGRY